MTEKKKAAGNRKETCVYIGANVPEKQLMYMTAFHGKPKGVDAKLFIPLEDLPAHVKSKRGEK